MVLGVATGATVRQRASAPNSTVTTRPRSWPVQRATRGPRHAGRGSAGHALVRLEAQPRRRAQLDAITGTKRDRLSRRQGPFEVADADTIDRVRVEPPGSGGGDPVLLVEPDRRATIRRAQLSAVSHPGTRRRKAKRGPAGDSVPRGDRPDTGRVREIEEGHAHTERRHEQQGRSRSACPGHHGQQPAAPAGDGDAVPARPAEPDADVAGQRQIGPEEHADR